MTIKEITNESIDRIEAYVRKDLVAIVHKLKNDENPVFINDADFFGNIKINEPSSFTFSLGERVQIEQIALFSNEIVMKAKDGKEFFKTKTKVNYDDTIIYRDFGRFFSSKHTQISDILDSETRIKELKSSLHHQILSLLKSLDVEEEIRKQYNEDMVSVIIQKGKPSGLAKCLLCILNNVKSKKSEFAIWGKISKDKCYWTTSNFSQHITNTHLQPKANNRIENRVEIESVKKDRRRTKKLVETETMKKQRRYTQSFEEKHLCEIETINEPDGTDIESIIFKQISIHLLNLNTTQANDAKKGMTFYCGDEEHLLQTANITRDGNCLFHAIVHQLNEANVDPNDKFMLANQLRATVVSHISENRDDFKMDLLDIAYSQLKEGEQIKEEDKDEAREKALKLLGKNHVWGGTETLKAVISLYKVNILNINEYGHCYFIGGFDISLTKTIILAYMLKLRIAKVKNLPNYCRDHYESVVFMEDETILSLAKMISIEMARKFESTKLVSNENVIVL